MLVFNNPWIQLYLIVRSAWCSIRNNAAFMSCFSIAWCNNVRPSVFFSLILAPAPRSFAASSYRLLHNARPRTVWPSESLMLKLGIILLLSADWAASTGIKEKITVTKKNRMILQPCLDWSQGYKTYFMLNSADYETAPAKLSFFVVFSLPQFLVTIFFIFDFEWHLQQESCAEWLQSISPKGSRFKLSTGFSPIRWTVIFCGFLKFKSVSYTYMTDRSVANC